MTTKIDITSSAFEKGIDFAKNFLDKLIMPIVEESGLLIKDKATFWRLKNQVRILNKAKKICEKNGISPKTISLKLLCPLLENASLEEDEVLQNKWAVLLSNLVDSEQNIENQVFPYILSQISINEFSFLEEIDFKNKKRTKRLTKEFNTSCEEKIRALKILESEIKNLKKNRKSSLNRDTSWYDMEIAKLQVKICAIQQAELIERINVMEEIDMPQPIPENKIRDFELSNLIRLGLIKFIQENTVIPQVLQIPQMNQPPGYDFFEVDLDINIESNHKYLFTELAKLFINACTEKQERTDKS